MSLACPQHQKGKCSQPVTIAINAHVEEDLSVYAWDHVANNVMRCGGGGGHSDGEVGVGERFCFRTLDALHSSMLTH